MNKKHEQSNDVSGYVKFSLDHDRSLFLAEPHGIITPEIVSEDLKRAKQFADKNNGPWTYCTDTSDVRLVHPFNILFLKEIKKLKKLKEIIVYAPSWGNRILIKLVSPIFKPDRVIKHESEFKQFLGEI